MRLTATPQTTLRYSILFGWYYYGFAKFFSFKRFHTFFLILKKYNLIMYIQIPIYIFVLYIFIIINNNLKTFFLNNFLPSAFLCVVQSRSIYWTYFNGSFHRTAYIPGSDIGWFCYYHLSPFPNGGPFTTSLEHKITLLYVI